MHPKLFPFIAASLLTFRAYRRKSLTTKGCALAWFIGYISARGGPLPFTSLLTFFISSTFITKIGAKTKRVIEGESFAASGNRSAWQVFSNGGVATAALLVFPSTPSSIYAVIAHYAACQGDTWSSELGVLAPVSPRLVLGLRKVPRGTNGAVTLYGLAAAGMGGALLSATCSVSQLMFPTPGVAHSKIWVVGVGAALVGSLIDSVLGQLLQRSAVTPEGEIVRVGHQYITGRDILTNNQVNFLTALVVTMLTLRFV